MIIEIEKPYTEEYEDYDIRKIYDDKKYYFNEETNEYFYENKHKSRFYFILNNLVHRIGKPAIEWSDGFNYWAENGKWHRLDGPAHDSNKSVFYKKEFIKNLDNYYIYGEFKVPLEFAKETSHLICKICLKFCKQECLFK